MKPILSLLLFFCLLNIPQAQAQEIQAKVSINADIIQLSDRRIFRDMELAFEQFINNRRWTNDVFRQEEKVKANIFITLETMPNIGSFTGSLQIQVLRPVYGSNYESILLNYADRSFQFEYVESQPLDFNENAFTNNLTSLLGFYSLIILAFDYDSFAPLGGTPFIDRAYNVVINAQQSPRTGWRQFESNRNRYWLVENMMNLQMIPVREAIYQYHRQGMDVFASDPDKGREGIITALKMLRDVHRLRPNAMLLRDFFDAKSDELSQIFSQGDQSLRREAVEILSQLDPTNSERYGRLLRQ
jgi:hypothetical protein